MCSCGQPTDQLYCYACLAAELRSVDAALARRPALEGLKTRAEKVERACNEAKRADGLALTNVDLMAKIQDLSKSIEATKQLAADGCVDAVKNIHDVLRELAFTHPISKAMQGKMWQVIGSYVTSIINKDSSELKSDCMQDSAYVAGAQAGYRYGYARDSAGLNKLISARSEYLKVLKDFRTASQRDIPTCKRESGHDGPCNGIPRTECLDSIIERSDAHWS